MLVRSITEELTAEAYKLLGSKDNVTMQVLFDLRYVGQEFTLPVPVTSQQLAQSRTQGDPRRVRRSA